MAITEGQLETGRTKDRRRSRRQRTRRSSRCSRIRTHHTLAEDFWIFLQGSYSNDTNVYAESDVDIVICLTEVYYGDISNLEPGEKDTYEAN